MANIKFIEAQNDVLALLSADPSEPVVEHAIKRAAIEFCAGSWVWKHLPDPLDVQAGEAVYDLETPSGAEVVVVIHAEYDALPLENKGIDWLDSNIKGWRTTQQPPRFFTQVDTDQIILAGVPDANITAGLVLTLALCPMQNATGIPAWLFNGYVDDLVSGAVARLATMQGKRWTDGGLAAYHDSKFKTAIAQARAAGVNALSRAPVRVTGHH